MEKLPNFENQGEGEGSPTIESIKKSRQDLEARVEVAKKQEKENLDKQLKDRETIVTEDSRLVSLLEEARSTLEYFETSQELGLLKEEKDVAELESLRGLVKTLQAQRDAGQKQYEAVMNNPKAYEKIWEEAHLEKEARELVEETVKELERRTNDLVESVEDLAKRQAEAYKDSQVKEKDFFTLKSVVDELITQARRTSSERETLNILNDYRPEKSKEFIAELEERRRNVGFFKGREKAAIDSILKERAQVEELGTKWTEWSAARSEYHDNLRGKAEEELASTYTEVETYSFEKEREVKETGAEMDWKIFSSFSVYSQVVNKLKKKAGLLVEAEGEWKEVDGKKEPTKRKVAEDKFKKLEGLWHDIHRRTHRGY